MAIYRAKNKKKGKLDKKLKKSIKVNVGDN